MQTTKMLGYVHFQGLGPKVFFGLKVCGCLVLF